MIKDNSSKDLLLKVIEETRKKYHFELSGFEILDNHFHFIIKTLPDGESISKIMQRIKSVFTKRYNKIHKRTGPLWNERFGSKIVEEVKDAAKYIIYLLWYIAYNPYRKYLVSNPREYQYSSINYYLDENFLPKANITRHNAFMNLGKTFSERVNAFLEFEQYYIERLWCQR